MHTFEIAIQRRSGDRWPVVIQQVISGADLPVRREGSFALDADELAGAAPREYGSVLGRALFRDEIRDAFKQALARADETLHVLLFVEADELRPLRWERLAAPLDGGWTPLALDQRTPFALHLPSATDRRFPPLSRLDLRALIFVANPTRPERWGLSAFDVAATVRGVRESLGPIPSEVLAEVEGAIGPPTLDALCNAITGNPYTLMHVVAHGRFKADDREPVVFFSTLEGEVAPVPAGVLIERLAKLRGAQGLPHFAFLSTCEGAAPEAEGVLGGLGQRLVRELGMPAVVAMTDRVTVASAAALAAEFYRRLRQHGEVDRALVEAYAGVAGRSDVMVPVPALLSRLAGRPLFSLAPDGHFTNGEIAHGLDRLRALLPDRAPVLAVSFESHAATLRTLLGADVEHLSRELQDERKRALAGVDELCLEGLDLSFEALANDQEPPPDDGRCPFKGLESFKAGDRPFFFGREAWVERLCERLARHPFLAVLGPSGSGKSSVVLAGLVPALQDREAGLEVVILTPGASPAAALETKLAEVGGRPAVIVVDQFEEVFTLCTDPAARQAFLDRLLVLSATRRVAVTMRADFWGDCAPYPALRERMLDHQELIPPLTPEELRAAMTRQAEAVGLRFEPGLVGTILDDVAGEPGAMPLLQHALLELWNRRHGRRLKAEEYQALGRVQGAIAKTAEAAYADLRDDRERDRARDIFLRLTRLNDSSAPGELRRDTRRRVRLEDLAPAGGDLAETKALVNRLADRRLVVTTPRGEERLTEVEVAHEALIRHWPRLIGWLDENRAILRLRQGITEAAEEWAREDREKDYLVHKGPRLQEAERLRGDARFGLSELERSYLDACVALREQDRVAGERLRRRVLTGLTTGLLVATSLAAFAFVQRRVALDAKGTADQRLEALKKEQGRSEKRRIAAEREAAIADARRLAASAALTREKFPQRSVLLATEAFRRVMEQQLPVPEAEEELRASLAVTPGFVLGRHRYIWGLAFSPDSRRLITAGYADNTVRVWDLAADDPSRSPIVLTGNASHPGVVAISRDSRWLATAGGDPAAGSNQTVKVWDLGATDTAGSVIVLRGPRTAIDALAFHPDARRVIAGARNDLWIWDLSPKDPSSSPIVLKGHESVITAIAISTDGRRLVSASMDKTARVWDLNADDPAASAVVLRGHEEYLNCLAISPDGRWLATGSDDHTVRLWELGVETHEVIANLAASRRILRGHLGKITSMALSPDGKRLMTGSNDRTARVWDLSTPDPAATPVVLYGHEGAITSVAFSPDGNLVLTGSMDGTARLWDLRHSDPSAKSLVLRGHDNEIELVGISPDGRWLATSGLFTARLRRLASPDSSETVLVLRGHSKEVQGLDFSPEGRWLATASWDGTVRLWDTASPDPSASATLLEQHDDGAQEVAFSRDGRWLAAGFWDGAVRLWDRCGVEPYGASRLLKGHQHTVWHIAFSPDGRWIVTSGNDGQRLWDLTAADVTQRPKVMVGHKTNNRAIPLFIGPEGRWLVTYGDYSDEVRLWDLKSTEPARSTTALTGMPKNIEAVEVSPDGRWLALGLSKDIAQLWDFQDATRGGKKPPILLKGHKFEVRALAFSPDGRWLVTGSGDLTARVWDLHAPDPSQGSRVLRGHENKVDRLRFSPDGHWLVTRSLDRTARIWDMTASDPSQTSIAVSIPNSLGESIVIDGESHWFAVASDDGTVRLWTLRQGDLLKSARRAAGRNLRVDEWESYFPGEPYRKLFDDLEIPKHLWVGNQ
jgi:WD40 repeat protein